LGFVVCCATAGLFAAIAAVDNANRPNEMLLIVLMT
jgi:hypothetical protein